MAENKKNAGTKAILPILYTFFVMGFCDVVGTATSHAKVEFGLSETMAGFIPSMVFVWFLLLSVPTAVLMNRIGRKATVQLSNAVTLVGMLLPFAAWNYTVCMVAFALLGIGNTMLQVSLNPLLTNVISGDKLTSSLTAGQVAKAVCSFSGPFIALFASTYLGSWKYIFPIYAGFTLISAVWLMLTYIPAEQKGGTEGSGIRGTFALLGDRRILLLTLGIACIVGVDAGTNTVAPKLLMERGGLEVGKAGLGSSVYFFSRTIGAFLGAFLLMRVNDVKYYRANIIFAIAALVALILIPSIGVVYVMLALIGFTCSCIFTVIFSAAIKARPDKANEVSGLMITGIFGGAVVPPLMGWASDQIGSQTGSLIVIGLCMAYCLFCAFRLSLKES